LTSKPKLLLHICCGPCATEVIRRLQPEYELTGFFYNPNIFPEAEFQRRRQAVEGVTTRWPVRLVIGDYEHDRFLKLVQGLENEPEGGPRCALCYRLRLTQAARHAQAHGCTIVASTLTIGPGKEASVINPIGREVCAQYGLQFLEADWKKRDGFKHSLELSRELGLYRQNYCGCEFSLTKPRE